ncbi:MAG: NUDIX domain-containing protein [Candidatus Paracaedibacteraceae bacterium]|nr:NUDIX domain-containing protein [Candidatus Paracaedibacteraceae bacterium]
MSDYPRVGVGVLIFNHKGEMLLGKRKNAHGNALWGNPGGHLEFGESLEDCAKREVLEETSFKISSPSFVAVTNDVFKKEGKHYISIFMKVVITENQTVQNLEPHKTEEWKWFSLDRLPSPLFPPLKQLFAGKTYGLKQQMLIAENIETSEPSAFQ